ncbi:conserved unknown protein [Ectocarpus siliculosus]|uniref:Sodium/calcium exchanger membrane region domain-containing protein n=1 Tax=Ectocarpus siliculosus TaxID=2880 RepID=D8LLM0_ECTSI|nr:conserved unknown protein [Ectocarpus siliculosus]|eukprot:CBN74651.1 conserved unknown protein [Ectocarpus siliculosus]
MADEEEEEGAAAACADNAFSGGGAGTVMLLVVAILFTFNGLAIVCDEFFQASLEKISEVLGLTPDVAGATFLAAGSSAPELFTSIADVFGPSNSIGVGTIVGSAMFNVLVIVALSAAVAVKSGTSGTIDHRVVARDVSFYTCSIFMLVAAASDGEIRWWEALIMVLAYGLYIVFMVYNSRILEMCSAPKGTVLPTVGGPELEALEPLEKAAAGSEEGEGDGGGRRGSQHLNRRASRALRVSLLQERRTSQGRRASYVAANEGNEDPMAAAAAAAVASVKKGSTARLSWDGQTGGSGGGAYTEGTVAAKSGAAAVVEGNKAAPEGTSGGYQIVGEETGDDLLAWPEGWMERFLFVFGLPFLVGLSLTVPDCSRPEYEKYYILTFVMSISWISIISSYMVTLATGAACILGVSAIVMGVLVLAVGTSVPDMIGSMIAAKNGEASVGALPLLPTHEPTHPHIHGRGDMAIANAIGSNVFNILLGLGGPWLFSSLVSGEPTAVDSEGATTALIILFCAVLMFVVSLILSRWNMNTKLAYSLLFTYASYVVYTITAEALK